MRREREAALYVIGFYGELDLASAECAATELRRCTASDVDEIVVDLSGLDFIDSTGLNILLQAYEREPQNGNRLRFLRGPAPVQRLIELTRLDTMLPFGD